MAATVVPVKVEPLATNEIADNGGYTHVGTVSYINLTETTNATAQTIKVVDIRKNDTILKIGWRLKKAFSNTADAAFNSDTMSVGDTSGVASFIAAKEVNVNGTVIEQFMTNTAVSYTAADALNVTFNAMAGKNLNALNDGEVEIFFQLSRLRDLERAMPGATSTSRNLTFGAAK